VNILMLGDARTEHLARWARHYRSRGDTVWVASAQDGLLVDVPLRLPLGRGAVGYPLLVPVLRRIIEELKPDVLAAHYLPNYGLMAVLSGFRPHILFAWGSDLLVLPKRGLLQRSRLRLVATRGQAFLVDGQVLVEPLVRLGAPAERVYVCPFGVDDDVMAAGAAPRTVHLESPVIVSTRRHEPSYQLTDLLEAVARLDDGACDVRLQVAGEGTDTPALKRRAEELGITDRLEWPGHLCRSRYVALLAGADIYVATSPSDSTSVSLLEAMGSGLAVIVPDIPGNREWVDDGRNGLLYPSGDVAALRSALRSLLAHPERRRALGDRARARIERDGRWSHTVRRADLLFGQLVNH